MNILSLNSLEREPDHPATVVTWGIFDGVHRGHQAILESVVDLARRRALQSCVMTFDRHPEEVLFHRPVPLLCDNDRKMSLIGALRIDRCVIVPFSEAFARTDAEVFIREIVVDRLRAAAIVLGHDSMFGRGRRGNIDSLRALVAEKGIEVTECAPRRNGEGIISSSSIREAVREGRLDDAERMLGRPFEIAGGVVKGDGRGKSLGFPTANIPANGYVLPPDGVYATTLTTCGREHPGVTNIGKRPTFRGASTETVIESHLPRWSGGDFYGEKIVVRFHRRIRDERAFPGREALIRQIEEDVRARLKHVE